MSNESSWTAEPVRTCLCIVCFPEDFRDRCFEGPPPASRRPAPSGSNDTRADTGPTSRSGAALAHRIVWSIGP